MKKHGNHGEERDEHMARIKADHDARGAEYPAELKQHLAAKERDER